MNKIVIASCCLFVFATNFGQSIGNNDTYLGIGSGMRTIAKNKKITEMPISFDSIIEISNIKYYLEPKKHEVGFNSVPIRPAKLKIVEPLDKLYPGFVKGAVGTYLMPYVEVYYNSIRSKQHNWGLNGLHHSALGNINDVGKNQFSDNQIGGFYKQFLRKQDLLFELNYNRNRFHYYGFSKTDSIIPLEYRENDDTTLQTFHLVKFAGELVSRNIGRDTNKLNYKSWLDYHLLNSQFGTMENNIVIGAEFGKFLNKEEFLGSISIDINNLTQPQWIRDSIGVPWAETGNENTTSAIVKANPYIYSRGKNWKAKIGLALHSNITQVAKFYFYPDVECSYSLFNNIFIPYIGINGGIKRNTMNILRLENPFIAENSMIQNTNQRLHLFGGIRGSISSEITFNLSAGFEKIGEILDNGNIENGMYFFVPDTISSYENKFLLQYDKIDITTFSGQITYQKAEKLKIFGKGEYYIYSPSEEDFAWQKPNYKFTFAAWYDIADKIVVKGSVFLVGARKSFSYKEPELDNFEYNQSEGRYEFTLKPFIDINLGLEYRYNKRISAFIDFNNFTSVKYQRWLNYPVHSINILGGVTYSF